MGLLSQEMSQDDIGAATKRVTDTSDSSGSDSSDQPDTPTGDPVADLYRRLKRRQQKRS